MLGETETLARYNVGGSSEPHHPSRDPNFHPAPRVVVTAERALPKPRRGAGLSLGALQARARSKGYWAIRSCYEPALRVNQALSGKTRVRTTLGAHGSVLGARLLGTDLKQRAVAQCLVRALRGLPFSPGAGRKVDVDWTIALYPGDAPVPEPPVSAAAASAKLPIPGAAIDAALAPSRAAVIDCMRQGRTRDAELWGRLALELTLASDGAVASSREVETTFPDRTVVGCVAQALGSARFPAPAVAPTRFVVAFRLVPNQAPPVPAVPVPGEPPAPSPPEPVPPEPLPGPHLSDMSSVNVAEKGRQ